VLNHDRFEELTSLAAIRELSREEYEELEGHKASCAQCRELFEETSSVATALFLSRSGAEEAGDSNSERHRRLRKAVSRQLPEVVSASVVERYRHLTAAAVAVAFLLGGGIGTAVGYRSRPATIANVSTGPSAGAAIQPTNTPVVTQKNDEPRLQAVIVDLQRKMDDKGRETRTLEEKLSASDQTSVQLQTRLDELQRQLSGQTQELAQARKDLIAARGELTQARESVSASEAKISSLEYKLAVSEARLTEVTASVEREQDMLSAGREIRDIMGARDLHIVDVIDRDGKGRVRKAFGRAFYTQGKSLIFYAFDLPTKNTADGKFVYAAWGSNSNNLTSKVAHSLGIFYNDDQTQHRWAMKFDDPKVLDEIDTVFVTLEPAGKTFANPTGKPLLEAYFGTPPNHP
jgi:hypothetical protein